MPVHLLLFTLYEHPVWVVQAAWLPFQVEQVAAVPLHTAGAKEQPDAVQVAWFEA